MDAEECKKIFSIGTGEILFVDVRDAAEIAGMPYFQADRTGVVNIPLSVIATLPKEELIARLESVAGEIGKPLSDLRVVMACRSGGRSALATQRLRGIGIPAENLEGGRIAWGETI
jgi:rhodanese-related sulfurtransferase